MARVTKKQLFEEIVSLKDEYAVHHEKMFQLFSDGKAIYGEYLVYGLYNNYNYIKLFGGTFASGKKVNGILWNRSNTKLRDYVYYKEEMEKDMKKLMDLIKEVEER